MHELSARARVCLFLSALDADRAVKSAERAPNRRVASAAARRLRRSGRGVRAAQRRRNGEHNLCHTNVRTHIHTYKHSWSVWHGLCDRSSRRTLRSATSATLATSKMTRARPHSEAPTKMQNRIFGRPVSFRGLLSCPKIRPRTTALSTQPWRAHVALCRDRFVSGWCFPHGTTHAASFVVLSDTAHAAGRS